MNKATYTFSLDIHESTAQYTCSMKQGETGRKMAISLREDNKPYIPTSDCRAYIYATKSDGTTIINACGINLADGVVTYDCSAQLTTAIGIAECELRVVDADENIICSPTFLVNVNNVTITDSTITSNNDLSAITNVIYNYKYLSGNIIWTNLVSGTYICNNVKIYTQSAYDDEEGTPLVEFASGIVQISVVAGATSASNVVTFFHIKKVTVSGTEKFAIYTCKIDSGTLSNERTAYAEDLATEISVLKVSSDMVINEVGVGTYRVIADSGKGIKFYESGYVSRKFINGILFVNQTPISNNKSWWYCGTVDSGNYGGKLNCCIYGVYTGNTSTLNTTLKEYETSDNKVTSVSSSSTDIQYPSALAVYNAIQAALYVEGSDTV